jgi:ribosomal protein S7
LQFSIQNTKPLMELGQSTSAQGQGARTSSRRKAKPVPVPASRATKLAIQWIIEGASTKKSQGHSMALRLCSEILNAYQKKGYAMKKKTDLHSLSAPKRATRGNFQSPTRPS